MNYEDDAVRWATQAEIDALLGTPAADYEAIDGEREEES